MKKFYNSYLFKIPIFIYIWAILYPINCPAQVTSSSYIKKYNLSLENIKDTIIKIEYISKDRMLKDTNKLVWLFRLNSMQKNKNPNIEFASKYILAHLISGNIYISSRNLLDTLWSENQNSNIVKMEYPRLFNFSLLKNYPTWKSGWYSQQGYNKPVLHQINADTIIFTQLNIKDSSRRYIYFINNKISKVDIVYCKSDHPLTFTQYKFTYHNSSDFNKLIIEDSLYKYTPTVKNKSKQGLFNLDSINLQLLDSSYNEIDTIKNKYYLFEYWYIGCYPCRKIMPHINNFYHRSDTNKLRIIGVNCIDPLDKIEYFKEKMNIQYKQFNCIEFEPIFNVNEFPSLILIDNQKNIIKKWVGYSPDILNEIENFLKTMNLII